MIDGQYTLAAKRRTEAFEVIDNSEDEAFQTDLYDWYLLQGRTDRLLEIQSPYIVSYLQRKSLDDVKHADLLWRYHSQNGHNHEAAEVQLELARSAFSLSLDRRIEYLGRAKANASATSPGIARHTRYKLLREVSDLLDVANIQSDLLQRLRDDERISSTRRPEVVSALNGSMLPLSVVSLVSPKASVASLMNLTSYTTNMPIKQATLIFVYSSIKQLITATLLTLDTPGKIFSNGRTKRRSPVANRNRTRPSARKFAV